MSSHTDKTTKQAIGLLVVVALSTLGLKLLESPSWTFAFVIVGLITGWVLAWRTYQLQGDQSDFWLWGLISLMAFGMVYAYGHWWQQAKGLAVTALQIATACYCLALMSWIAGQAVKLGADNPRYPQKFFQAGGIFLVVVAGILVFQVLF